MFARYDHRQRDVELVMGSLHGDPRQLGVLVAFGRQLREDLVTGLREVIATGVWTEDWHVRAEAAQWRGNPRFRRFLEVDLEDRRNRGPKAEHL
ncbi:hypothetical protein [Embleya sp. MST-111070]|uniref:hypothetical protein n=1 Tax=Embleya sp. MST-111070 TaxID=3398231 RepID=UPI003F7392DA